ncbi:MAG: hypothetical protein AABZ85_07945, partial [Thermodesulfobacteriota bacterium]
MSYLFEMGAVLLKLLLSFSYGLARFLKLPDFSRKPGIQFPDFSDNGGLQLLPGSDLEIAPFGERLF